MRNIVRNRRMDDRATAPGFSDETKSQVNRRVAAYIGFSIVIFVIFSIILSIKWLGTVQLHTDMELSATIISLVVAIVALVHYYADKSNLFLFIGAGFLGTAFLDGYHAVVTSAAFSTYFPSDLSSLIPWSWIASRFFISFFLCLSLVAGMREKKLGASGKVSAYTVYWGAGLLTIISFIFFAFVPLPPAYYPTLFFHRPEEFVPGVLFLIALIGYLYKGNWKYDAFEFWLILFLILGCIEQCFYMSLSDTLFDTMFDAAHVLKIISYVLVLVGLLISMSERFKYAIKSSSRLKKYALQLEEKNAELEKFSYIASHDLKEPLRKIETYAGFLEDECKDSLSDDGKNYIERMRAASKRLANLIDALLSYSRSTRGEESFERVDLNDLATHVLDDLETCINESNAQVDIMNTLPVIDANRIQFGQVLQNLIGNALKFHKENEVSIVKISSTYLNENSQRVRRRENAMLCKLTIADNGIGFDEKYKDRIFGVFQRLHSKGEYEGSGIGLSICKKIIDIHGGDINVHSTPGIGTIIEIIIPLKHNKH